MKKKKFLLAVCFFLSLKIFAQNNDMSSLIKNEAANKASYFLNLIPQGNEKAYGFNDRNDFSKITIGNPYETYYFNVVDKELKLVIGNEWRVPVLVDGKYITLLTVQINDGKPEVVDMGGNVLAQKLQEFENFYPSTEQHVIIRNTILSKDYIPTNFKSLIKQNAQTNPTKMDIDYSADVYLVNAGRPTKVAISDIYNETIKTKNSPVMNFR